MSVDKRWTILLAAIGGAALALSLRAGRKRRCEVERVAHKADLHEWENEGGNLAGPVATPAPALAQAPV